jgi:hypothetical protein
MKVKNPLFRRLMGKFRASAMCEAGLLVARLFGASTDERVADDRRTAIGGQAS